MIGAVYTAPEARGRGLARACIEACLHELERRGVPLAALWSDRHDFYARLGFLPAGREHHYRIDARACRRAASRSPTRYRVAPAQAEDWPGLEALYASKPSRARRPHGALRRLAAAPETHLLVARRRGRARAYAALGRGDDFPDVVHEWAGEPEAVLACLERLCRDHAGTGSLGWLVGPLDEAPAPALRGAGLRSQAGCFALLQLLDPVGAWRAATAGKRLPGSLQIEHREGASLLRATRGSLRLAPSEALELLCGPALPERVGALLEPAERRALGAVLPFPLYLWGFDSV